MNARFRLTVLQPGRTPRELAADPELDLLQQLRRAGFDVPQACRNGNCGRCYAKLLQGQASKTLQPDTLALCISHAHSDMKLALPATSQWQRYACQLLAQSDDQIRVRLPAGKIVVPDSQYSRFVLFTAQSAAAVTLIGQRQRILEFQIPPEQAFARTAFAKATFARASNQVVHLLCVNPSDGGHYRLLYKRQTLVSGLNASVVREIRKSLLQSGLDA